MAVVVKSFSEFLNLLVSSFNLSTIFPSTVFVIAVRAFVLPSFFGNRTNFDLSEIAGSETGLLLLAIAVIAYFLDASNYKLTRILEGYSLVMRFPFKLVFEPYWKAQKSYVEKTIKDIRKLDSAIEGLLIEIETASLSRKKELKSLVDQATGLRNELSMRIANKYPTKSADILPTPFGNVIRSAEEYPRRLLGMDAVVLWPFLVPTLVEKGYGQFVARQKAMLDFLINTLALTFLFSLLLFCGDLISSEINGIAVFRSIVLAPFCFVLYYIAIQAAIGWGETIRTAFVLHRDDLRNTLGLRHPSSLTEEIGLWEKTSQFFDADFTDTTLVESSEGIFDYIRTRPISRRNRMQK